jgi:hypothetical protein
MKPGLFQRCDGHAAWAPLQRRFVGFSIGTLPLAFDTVNDGAAIKGHAGCSKVKARLPKTSTPASLAANLSIVFDFLTDAGPPCQA